MMTRRTLNRTSIHLIGATGARCNYPGPDRPDIQYSAKEICRWMSSPTYLGQDALKRLCKFLVGRKRLVFRYPC